MLWESNGGRHKGVSPSYFSKNTSHESGDAELMVLLLILPWASCCRLLAIPWSSEPQTVGSPHSMRTQTLLSKWLMSMTTHQDSSSSTTAPLSRYAQLPKSSWTHHLPSISLLVEGAHHWYQSTQTVTVTLHWYPKWQHSLLKGIMDYTMKIKHSARFFCIHYLIGGSHSHTEVDSTHFTDFLNGDTETCHSQNVANLGFELKGFPDPKLFTLY